MYSITLTYAVSVGEEGMNSQEAAVEYAKTQFVTLINTNTLNGETFLDTQLYHVQEV
jgi:hypothetical protein